MSAEQVQELTTASLCPRVPAGLPAVPDVAGLRLASAAPAMQDHVIHIRRIFTVAMRSRCTGIWRGPATFCWSKLTREPALKKLYYVYVVTRPCQYVCSAM